METCLWDYQSDDSEDGYLSRASQAYEESVVHATVEAAKMTTAKHEPVTLSGEYKTDGCTSEQVFTPKRVTPERWGTPKHSGEVL